MRILVAPDKFKTALSARDAAVAIAAGVRDILPGALLDLVPIADGGEGTAEALYDALDADWVTCAAHDALGREIRARYAWAPAKRIAVLEMSEVAGSNRVSQEDRDPASATTFGVGEMVMDAARRGADAILIGLGGSITNDGGLGLARALGFTFLDAYNHELSLPLELLHLEQIRRPGSLTLPEVVALADVTNPLLGPRGATHVFGPQKGVGQDQLELFEGALTRLARETQHDLGVNCQDQPGAGAAGGLGFGLMAFCDAKLQSGFDYIAELLHLRSRVAAANAVITGEGSLDAQTLQGKAPCGIAILARDCGRPVYAVVGRAAPDEKVRRIFDDVVEVLRADLSEADARARAPELLRERTRELAEHLRALK